MSPPSRAKVIEIKPTISVEKANRPRTRWVIKRSFAWLGRNRRLAKDFEHLTEASTAMVALAIILLTRRLANP
jgi:transposase